MGLFRKKKNAVVVEKTATQKLNDEIKLHTSTVANLERLKPRINKFITHYKKLLDPHTLVYSGAITLSFKEGFKGYPDGFFAFADKLKLNIEPMCESTYNYKAEKSFVVRAKSKWLT